MPKIMWSPSAEQVAQSNMTRFMNYVALGINDYQELYDWSIQNAPAFWKKLWEFLGIQGEGDFNEIMRPAAKMQDTKWFPRVRLNFAQNLLRNKDNQIAVLFNNELDQRRTLTYQELYRSVAQFAHHLRSCGVTVHDRVAAIMPNLPQTLIAMLATTSIGAIWSSCSPEFGEQALFDRINQIQPKVLISTDGYFYAGKRYDNNPKLDWLLNKISSIKEVVIANYTEQLVCFKHTSFDRILENEHPTQLEFVQLPFNHPVYIMYSSGTTGMPKCIVHGAGGTLLQHLKELVLHTNLTSKDRILYYTTCGWMMWNWYISSLAVGATVVQYDGAPLYPSATRLIDFLAAEKITLFGTSAKYISALEKNHITPMNTHNLESLHTVLSTGSPLVQSNYEYVYSAIKKNVCLSSISGGTDIISCFALGNPNLPVYCSELQCIGLGMQVKVYDEEGNSVVGKKGELVCTAAFPCMPVYFWNDPQGEKYQQAYFDKFPNVWAHGDFAELTSRATLIIYGRSDATLNPAGVRIGTAEIYRQVEKIPQILESLAVSQDWQDDCRIILFIVLKEGFVLTPDLQLEIKTLIKEHCSPRHVPAKIIAVPEIPKTLSGKIVELAVRELIHNRPVHNIGAIANSNCLAYFKDLEELKT